MPIKILLLSFNLSCGIISNTSEGTSTVTCFHTNVLIQLQIYKKKKHNDPTHDDQIIYGYIACNVCNIIIF